MNCKEFERLLSEYLDGELDNFSVTQMDRHRDSCPACHSLFEEVHNLRSSLNEFPWIEPSEDLVRCILKRTSGEAVDRGSFWNSAFAWFSPLLSQRHIFATLMVLVFFSFATNMLGPEFTAAGQSRINPAVWGERVSTFSGDLYKQWRRFSSFKERIRDEIWLLKDDFFGRLDYHLTMALFRGYEDSTDDEGNGLSPESRESGSAVPQTEK